MRPFTKEERKSIDSKLKASGLGSLNELHVQTEIERADLLCALADRHCPPSTRIMLQKYGCINWVKYEQRTKA